MDTTNQTTCKQCSKVFTFKPDPRYPVRNFCSVACGCVFRNKHREKRIKPKIPCGCCGAMFLPRDKDSRYCSKSCKTKHQRRLDPLVLASRLILKEYKQDQNPFRFEGWTYHPEYVRYWPRLHAKERYHADPKAWNDKCQEWRRKNPDKVRARMRRWKHSGSVAAVNNRLTDTIRGRIYSALKLGGNRRKKAELLIGCTIDELRNHIQQQFIGHMAWNNWGKTWHVDHRIPLSVFDLTRDDEVKRACHYTNLRPLWAKANLRKNASLPPNPTPCLL